MEEATSVSRRRGPGGETKATPSFQPMGPKEVSKITAAPTAPPPCDDLPSYPSVPFLLHPHKPLLLWCSSSAVHAYDFVNHQWEAGGPQQLQAHLQGLHHLPIAAADCICLKCGSRSSALRDSGGLNKNHTRMRRSLSHNDSCPYDKHIPDHFDTPVVPPPLDLGATEIEGSAADGAAASDAVGATASRDEATAARNPTAASVPPAVVNSVGTSPAGCVWVTAGEDKYLHFVDVGSYKLLRSRLQRKKLSSAIFLSSATRPAATESPPPAKERLTADISSGSWQHQHEEAVPASWCSRSLTQEQQQRPVVQLLVADKFGDVYLLRDCLGAPPEQSLAGDLLSERMRTLPSVQGVRVSATSATGASLLSDASCDIPGMFADGAATSGARQLTSVVKPSASARSAGVRHTSEHDACQSQTPNDFVDAVRLRNPVEGEANYRRVSGQATDLGRSAAAVVGGDERAAAASAVPVPNHHEEGSPAEQGDEVKNLSASLVLHAKGDGISNPLLLGSGEEEGEIEQREGSAEGSTGAAVARCVAVKSSSQSEAVTSLQSAATAGAACNAANTKASAGVTNTASTFAAMPAFTGGLLGNTIDAERLHVTFWQKGTDDCATNRSTAGKQETSADSNTLQKPETQQEWHEGHQEGLQETHRLQQQTGRREWVLRQQRAEEDQLNTRERRFRNNAWQRERARLWRQQHLTATKTRAQQEQQLDVDWWMTVGARPHPQREETAEEDFVTDDFADIPLLSHLTTIIVMKVLPGSSLPSVTYKNSAVPATPATCEADAVAAPDRACYTSRLRAAETGRDDRPAPPTTMDVAFSSGCNGSSAARSSRWAVSSPRLHAPLSETVSEGAAWVSQVHPSTGWGGGADVLLTADRDEKVRICFLEQPWSIESFYLGHSEFVVDCLLIADGCGYDERGGNAFCGGCNSSGTTEGSAEAEGMTGSGTAESCESTSNHSSVKVGTTSHESSSRSEKVGTAWSSETSAGKKLLPRQRALQGKLGVSAAADGTLQVWCVSDGVQIDKLLLNPHALFDKDSSDLSCVLTCCEEASAAVPSKDIKEQHTPSSMPPQLLLPGRLLPSSLLFDEDQRLLVVECVKLRGLLLIPVEQREGPASAASRVPLRTPLLSRHPFFIPFPLVPAAVLLVYHSLEELNQAPALAQAARVLRPLLSSSPVLHREGRPSHGPHHLCSICSTEWTSSDARRLEEHCAPLTLKDHAGDRGVHTVPEAIPFVWWIDEMGRLRPPVCVSVLLLLREQHRQLQGGLDHAGASNPGACSRTPSSKQILPCVEGCSPDLLGMDYGTSSLPTNFVYFWKRTRSSTCPTQAERAARRLRHSHLSQREQLQGSMIMKHTGLLDAHGGSTSRRRSLSLDSRESSR